VQNRELVERGVGILATFVVLRQVSRWTLGVSFPGTATAVLATATAAACAGDVGPVVCRASKALNYPGDTAGRYIVGAADKGIELIQNRRAAGTLSRV